MPDYKVGDEVTVYWTGCAEPGVIYKIGRSLVHIRSRGHVTAFRIGDQRSTGRQVGSGTWFTTLAQEQAQREDRERKAWAILRKRGITVAFRRPTLEQIEALAEVVKDWED